MVTLVKTTKTKTKRMFKKRYAAKTRMARTRIKRGIVSRYNAPILFKRTVASKNFQLVAKTATGTGTSPPSVTIDNGGFLTLDTGDAQETVYFAISQAFCLQDDPNYTELSSICEKYKLVGVKVRIIPWVTAVTAQDAGNPSNSQIGGYIHHVIDYDDYDVPTASNNGIDALRQYSNYKWNRLTKGVTRYIKPKIAVPAYQTGVTTAYTPVVSRYIDEKYPKVEHYGIKMVFEVANPAASIHYLNFKWENTYYFKLKDRR